MRTHIQKWGNSLAVRIPRAFAAEARLADNTPVELSLVEGKLVVAPVTSPSAALDELLAGITDDNIHGEVDTGPAVGNEAW
jgi:antitoxin MazE